MKNLFRIIVRLFKKPSPPLTRKQKTDREIGVLRANGMVIGEDVGLVNVTLDSLFPFMIEIGSNVLITHATVLAHDASPVVFGDETRVGRVKIGDRVFVGAGAVMLPGVEIGSRSMVGANAVVSRDVPANSVVAGNPARVVANVDDWLARRRANGELVAWPGGIVPSDADGEAARRLVATHFGNSPLRPQ